MSGRVHVTSWSGLDRGSLDLVCERDVAGIGAAFERARRERRRMLVRGAGLSFDGQAIGDDRALVLGGFDRVTLDPETGLVTVGASATWGRVFDRIAPEGWMIPTMVSTSHATIGGTLSANSMSRATPVAGKEGRQVVAIDLVTPDGALVRACRTEHPDLFHAAIGGWGAVGAIVSATYQARPIPRGARVAVEVERHSDLGAMADALIPPRGDAVPAPYAICSVERNSVRALLLRARPAPSGRPRSMLPHRPASPARVPLEWLVNRSHLASSAFWRFTADVYMPVMARAPFSDDLRGFTFFMDGHVRAKETADRLGVPFRIMQQTFVVPSAERRLLGAFLARAIDRFHAEGLAIGLLDLLWLPADEPFCLSSSAAGAGYACTFTFEGPVATVRARRAFADLAEEVADIGGRVHLVKNVFASPETLARTYAGGLARLSAVKRRVDPDGILRNALLERCFPGLFER